MMFPSGGGATVRAPHLEDQTTLALIYFGRGRLATMKATAGDSRAGEGQAAVDTPLRTGVLGPRAPAHATGSDGNAARPLPEGSVSLLNLKNAAGQDVMIYTCEPTLLPPIAPEAGNRRQESGHRSRRERR
jgi:hypothetical protein